MIINILLRIITYPFALVLILVAAFRDSFLWVRYGGEMFLLKKDDKATISSIYDELKRQRGL